MFKNSKPVIAIDGTAGSGKGTLAKNLSKELGLDHLDTGLLYRIYAFENVNNIGNHKIEININNHAVWEYLSLNYVLSNSCMIKGVKKLDPGCFAFFSNSFKLPLNSPTTPNNRSLF